MNSSRKVLILSAALVLGSALGASAADLYGGGLKDAPVMAPMPAPSAGWYARVDGGYNWLREPDVEIDQGFTVSNVNIDNSWSIGGGIGHYFGRGFRGDLTIDHLFDADVSADIYKCNCYFGTAQTKLDSTVFLANLYYDFNRGGRFVPYVGAGIGFAHNRVDGGTVTKDCGCVATFDGGTDNKFAWAAMAGFAWKVRGGEPTYVGGLKDSQVVAVNDDRALWLDVGYRYLSLGDVKSGDLVFNQVPNNPAPPPPVDPKFDNLGAHELRVGLRYDFN